MAELPEPWNAAAERAGVRQTYRGIGDRAGLSHVTVRRLIAEGRTSQATVSKVAEALGVDVATVYEWAGVELSEWGPWTPPREAHKMPPRARAAIEELIRVIAEGASWSGPPRPEEPAVGLSEATPVGEAFPPPGPTPPKRGPGAGRGKPASR